MLPCSSKAAASGYSKHPLEYGSAHQPPCTRSRDDLTVEACGNTQFPELWFILPYAGQRAWLRGNTLILAGVLRLSASLKQPLVGNWEVTLMGFQGGPCAYTCPRIQLWFRNPAQGLRGGEDDVKRASPHLLWPRQSETEVQSWETMCSYWVGISMRFAFRVFIAITEHWALSVCYTFYSPEIASFSPEGI